MRKTAKKNLKNKKRLKQIVEEEQTNEKKLQEKETQFDKMNELYLRNKHIEESELKKGIKEVTKFATGVADDALGAIKKIKKIS